MSKVALALAQNSRRILRSRGKKGVFNGHVLRMASIDVYDRDYTCVSHSNG